MLDLQRGALGVTFSNLSMSQPQKPALTHLDESGNARMVDVGGKAETRRIAVAAGRIGMSAEALAAIRNGDAPKGDVLAAARIAGIMAAKKTAELIPLCHPLPLTRVAVEWSFDEEAPAVRIEVTSETLARTGVEMEALTACAIAALTVYDMVKGVERGVEIRSVRLISKSGGKSGEWIRHDPPAGADAHARPATGPRPGARAAGRIKSKPKSSPQRGA